MIVTRNYERNSEGNSDVQVDTAPTYQNEAAVGKSLRGDVHLTVKVPKKATSAAEVRRCLDDSLAKLQVARYKLRVASYSLQVTRSGAASTSSGCTKSLNFGLRGAAVHSMRTHRAPARRHCLRSSISTTSAPPRARPPRNRVA